MGAQNLGDENRVNRQRKREKLAQDLAVSDLIAVMKTRQGRSIVRQILAATKVSDQSFRGEPYWDAFRQGEQNVGKWIITQLRTHCLEAMRLMEDEERRDLKAADAPEPDEEKTDE